MTIRRIQSHLKNAQVRSKERRPECENQRHSEKHVGEPPLVEGTDFVYTDVSDMAHVLPAVESVLYPHFFTCTTLIFRLLRRNLDMHLINPISEDAVLAVEVFDADREDPRILEHIRFLLFLGASATRISNSLKNPRQHDNFLYSTQIYVDEQVSPCTTEPDPFPA